VAQPPTVLESGTELAGFRIESLIGQGETGTVYRATQVRLGREVALKVLAADASADPEFPQRFIRESKRAASLYQPNILPVYDVGEADGVIYVAMRYVEGGDLGRLLQENGQISASLALEISRQIALALAAAHSARLVHGDVKPTNILLGDDEHVYLADFGFAGSASMGGTRGYSAPEQLDGDSEVGGQADVYALGGVLATCLGGQDLPPGVDAIVGRATEKDPANRYSAPELAAALGAVLAGLDGVETGPESSSHESDTQPIAVALPAEPEPAPELEPAALDEAEAEAAPPVVAVERRRSRRRFMLAALALGIVAAGIGAVFAFGSTGSKPLSVPRVLGIRAGRAEARLRRAHFTPVIKHGSSELFTSGVVYRATPSQGSALQSGRRVTIWVSTGPPTSVVPNLVGKNLSQAERALAAAHLRLIVKQIPSGKYKVGRITQQAPGRGAHLPVGGAMTLWVSTGQPKGLVPDVRGESAQQATRDLRNTGFRVKNAGPHTATSNSALAGTVAGQSPVGVKAPKKTIVTLYLYYYVAPPPPPSPPPTVAPPSTTGVT
jgi:eukaryotic-like serine/threonine-protein kinase